MDDLVSKTQELTNLVTSLRGQGEDDSDLQGILAQLQAAVAKRAGTSSTEVPIADLTAKSEPVDTFDSPGMPKILCYVVTVLKCQVRHHLQIQTYCVPVPCNCPMCYSVSLMLMQTCDVAYISWII